MKTQLKPLTIPTCLHCGSHFIKKNGKRKTNFGYVQRYKCVTCNKRFTWNVGFNGKKHTSQMITLALSMYFGGQSLSKVCHTLKMLGISPTKQTIWNWINEYSFLMSSFLSGITPEVGNNWRADEMFTHVKGDLNYVFMMMDDDTRYILSQELADTKMNHDAKNLFQKGRDLAKKNPSVVTTDGLPAYKRAFQNVFYTNVKPRSHHNSIVKITGDISNNLMERCVNSCRDREKTFRGLQTKHTPMFTGYQVYFNHIRPHEALKGKTPGEAAGITIESDNKWLVLIQNAAIKG